MIREPLIFEISGKGKRAFSFPPLDVPPKKELLSNVPLRQDIEGFPQVSEVELVRHFTRLSKTNYCVDEGFYPLGSCTMKYNPKLNERVASLPEFVWTHPFSPSSLVQGNLEILKRTEELLSEITGMEAISLQPSAGAHGELLGMMLIRARQEDKGDPRKIVLIPDSAHGTNPSSAHVCGYKVHEVKSNEEGKVDLEDLSKNMNQDVAGLMITNPNTLGIFESDIKKICEIVHSQGGYVYMDGANMNALVGVCKPGDMNVDIIHLNLHKTFSTPHGGGGPGSGPLGVTKELEPYLPSPVLQRKGKNLFLDFDRPQSIGKIRSFYGNFLVVIKALAYILTLGHEGLREVSEGAVLNSNYVRKNLEDLYEVKYKTPTLHECVFSDKYQKDSGISNIDIAKRLLDYSVHSPTVSFPLVVHGALMTEPTETESRRDLEAFIHAMKKIDQESKENPDLLKQAPHISYVRRLDETLAARNPVLRWKKETEET